MPEYRYAAYPSAKVYDAAGNQIQHLLWGDWVRLEGEPADGMVPVHVRGVDGWMREKNLQKERLLEIVFVDVGQGDGCLVVTPDDKKLVIDAGDKDNMHRFLKWRFNFRSGIRKLDVAIITHPDRDHYFGFGRLFRERNLKFSRIYHNGIMEQQPNQFGAQPVEDGVRWVTDLVETKGDLEAFLATPERYGKKLYPNLMKDALAALAPNGDIRMLGTSGDPAEKVYLEGFGAEKELSIRVLGPVPEFDAAGKRRLRWFKDKPSGGSYDSGKTKNGHSVILMLEYRGLRVLLGGDLNSSAEAFLLQHYTDLDWPPADGNEESILIDTARLTFGADIAKCCHHGSADFTDVFMAAVHPAATVVSSGDEESHAHPRCDTLGAIGRHGRGWRPLILSTELSRSTRERETITREVIDRLLARIDAAEAPEDREALLQERNRMLDELTTRNVTTYGAINLRTDGHRVVMATRLEVPRTGNSGGKKTLSRWDIYTMERKGGGPLVYTA